MSCGLEIPRGGDDGLMLGRPCEDGRLSREPMRCAEDREVDGLGAGGGESDLGAGGVQRGGEMVAGCVERGSGRPAFGMEARRVPAGDVGQRLGNFWECRGGAGVVEVHPVRGLPQARLYRLWSGWCSRSFSVPWNDLR